MEKGAEQSKKKKKKCRGWNITIATEMGGRGKWLDYKM